MRILPTLYLVILISFLAVNNSYTQQLDWENLNVPMGAEIQSVVEDSSGVFFISIENAIYKSEDNLNTWQKVDYPYEESEGANWLTLFVLENGSLMSSGKSMKYSSDKGKTWQYADSSQKGLQLYHLVKGFDGSLYGSSATIYKYDTQGKKFKALKNLPDDKNVSAICFDKNGHLYAGSGQGGVFYTSDNGETWQAIGLDTLQILNLAVTDEGTVLAADQYHGGIYYTTDLGKKWEWKNHPEIGKDLDQYEFKKINGRIYVNISGRHLGYVTDEGKEIKLIENVTDSLDFNYYSIQPGRDGKLYIPSNSTLFVVDPDKQTWTEKNPAVEPIQIFSLLSVSDSIIFVGSNNSGVYRTTDKGKNWQDLRSGYHIKESDAKQIIKTNKGYLIFNRINPLISQDDGDSWQPIPFDVKDTNFKYVNIRPDSNETLHGFYQKVPYIYDSKDYGKTWQRKDIPLLDSAIDIAFGKDIIIALVGKYKLFVSTDKGKSWNRSVSNPDFASFSPAIAQITPDDEIIYYLDDLENPYLMKSTDRGTTWKDLLDQFPSKIYRHCVKSPRISPDGELFIQYYNGEEGQGVYRNVEDSLFYRIYKGNGKNYGDNSIAFNIDEKYIYIITSSRKLLRTKRPDTYPSIDLFDVSPIEKQVVDQGDTLIYSIKARDNHNNPVDGSIILVNNELDTKPDTLFTSAGGSTEYRYVVSKGSQDSIYVIQFNHVNPDYIFKAQNQERLFEIKNGGMGVEDNNNNEAMISPNPAKDMFQLTISVPEETEINLELFNVLGKCEMSREFSARQGINTISINLLSVANGTYYIRLTYKAKTVIVPVVVSR